MKTIILLLAVGLAAAGNLPAVHRLPIYGSVGSVLPLLGVRNLGSTSPLLSENLLGYPLLTLRNLGYGGIIPEKEILLNSLLRKPVVVVLKAKEGTELEAYLLEHGLSSVAEYPHTRLVQELLSTEKAGLLLGQSTLYSSPALRALTQLPVTQLQVPAGLKLANLLRSTTSYIPVVLLEDREVINKLEIDELLRIGSLEVTENSITLPY
ncbi:hypothetical protein C0J52_22932 [Blattella germanica]|nr:hypothetical protein C0J52_22932 [Blattella germanica]